ncbi:hypothetical protein CHS0354_032411, partial [Potamilus streckersoni]
MESKVERINGTKYIDLRKYLKDIKQWDINYGVKHSPRFDHIMFFTRYKLYMDSVSNYKIGSATYDGICYPGERIAVVEARGLFWTAFSAAHELGHNLGAEHDDMKKGSDLCDPKNNFIMGANIPETTLFMSSRNPWLFSNCSVKAFLETLDERDCVHIPGEPYDPHEYQLHLSQKPGVVYNVTEQCRLIVGRYSDICKTTRRQFTAACGEKGDAEILTRATYLLPHATVVFSLIGYLMD